MYSQMLEGSGSQIITRFTGYCYATGFMVMFVLAVAATGRHKIPSIMFQQLNDLAHFHNVESVY